MTWCWLGIHKFTIWENKGLYSFYADKRDRTLPTQQFMNQERHCKDCNKLQYRREYV